MECGFGSELALAYAEDEQGDNGNEEIHADEFGGGEHTSHHRCPMVKLAISALVLPQENKREDRKKQHQPIRVPPQAVLEHGWDEQQQEVKQYRAVGAELVLHIDEQKQCDKRGQHADELALHQHQERQVAKLSGPAQRIRHESREPKEGQAVMVIIVGDEVL